MIYVFEHEIINNNNNNQIQPYLVNPRVINILFFGIDRRRYLCYVEKDIYIVTIIYIITMKFSLSLLSQPILLVFLIYPISNKMKNKKIPQGRKSSKIETTIPLTHITLPLTSHSTHYMTSDFT